MIGHSPGMRFGVGLALAAAVAVSPSLAIGSNLAEDAAVSAATTRKTIVILPPASVQVAAGAATSCSCGAFTCKGKEFPACTIQCVEPAIAACECGFCERTLGSPNWGALGPVANDCVCQ